MLRATDENAPSVLINFELAPEIGIEYFRLFREIELQAKILEFLLPQYEQAKISESREKGDLYILDAASVPEKKFKPKRSFLVLGWMFISFVLLYLFILSIEWLKQLSVNDPKRYALVSGVLNGFKPKNLFNWKDDDISSTGGNR